MRARLGIGRHRNKMGRAIRHIGGYIFFAVVFAGCATVPSGPPLLRDTAEGNAELYIFNVSGWTLIPSNQDVTANEQLVASLPRGSYKRVYVRPGTHELRLHGRRLKLEAVEGQTYYVTVGYRPELSWLFPLAGDPVVIKQISEEEARRLIGEMKPQ